MPHVAGPNSIRVLQYPTLSAVKIVHSAILLATVVTNE